jgi:hypothetical protein
LFIAVNLSTGTARMSSPRAYRRSCSALVMLAIVDRIAPGR